MPAFAVAYGASGVITISLLESIAHRLLFESRNGPKVSHFSAFVLFKSCSWATISRWTIGHCFGHGEKSEVKLSIRGVFAIVIRLALVLAEIAILLLAVPQVLPVLESEVGSTRLMFSSNRTQLQRYDPGSVTALAEAQCPPDPIPYAGFSPLIARYMCMSLAVLPVGLKTQALAQNFDLSTITSKPSTENVTLLIHVSMEGDFRITVTHSGTVFVFLPEHVLQLENDYGRLLNLPVRNLTATSAVESMLAHPKYRRICVPIPV